MNGLSSLLLALLSATGLLDLGLRQKFGTGLCGLVRDKLAALEFGDIATREEMDEHHREWDFKDRFHGLGHHGHFHTEMKTRMQEVKQCHITCGMDTACHQQCPKPWKHLEKKCEAVTSIMSCHKACGHDHACHVQCPLPKCPKMAQTLGAALQCHGSCGADRACHSACPRPMHHLKAKCDKLDEVMTCHKGCGYDCTCHQKCPKMMEIWGRRGDKHQLWQQHAIHA